MAINLHLQNLPRTATNLDIRRFFYGLDIPEGGVQIVGGPDGDAFITFSTEDGLLRALMFDRQPLLGQPVKLFLANRDDMERIIEQRHRDLEAAKQARFDSLHDQHTRVSDHVGRSSQRFSSTSYDERDKYGMDNRKEHITVGGITLDPNNPFDIAVKKLLESKASADRHSSHEHGHSRKRSHSSRDEHSDYHSSDKSRKMRTKEPEFDISLPYHALVAQRDSQKKPPAVAAGQPDEGTPPWLKHSQPGGQAVPHFQGSADDLDFRSHSNANSSHSRPPTSSHRDRDKGSSSKSGDDGKRRDRRESRDKSGSDKGTDRDRRGQSRDGQKGEKKDGKGSASSRDRDKRRDGRESGKTRERRDSTRGANRSRSRDRQTSGDRGRRTSKVSSGSRSRSRSRDRRDRRDSPLKEEDTYNWPPKERKESNGHHGRRPQFIRVTNIAPTVTARDLRDFFCYYIIPEGGISLKMGEEDSLIAFIKGFNDKDDVGMEVLSGRDLHGRLVEISCITERQYDLKLPPESDTPSPPLSTDSPGYAPPYPFPPPPLPGMMPPYPPPFNPWMPPGPMGVGMPLRMPMHPPVYSGAPWRPPVPMIQPIPNMPPTRNDLWYLRLTRLPVDITACNVWSWFNGPAGYCRGVTYVTNRKDHAFAFAGFSTKEQRDYEMTMKPDSRSSQADTMYKQLASLDESYKILESTPTGKDNLVLMKRSVPPAPEGREKKETKKSSGKTKREPQRDAKRESEPASKSSKSKRSIETHTSDRGKKAKQRKDVKGTVKYVKLDSSDKKSDSSKTKSVKDGHKPAKDPKKTPQSEKKHSKDSSQSSKDNQRSSREKGKSVKKEKSSNGNKDLSKDKSASSKETEKQKVGLRKIDEKNDSNKNEESESKKSISENENKQSEEKRETDEVTTKAVSDGPSQNQDDKGTGATVEQGSDNKEIKDSQTNILPQTSHPESKSAEGQQAAEGATHSPQSEEGAGPSDHLAVGDSAEPPKTTAEEEAKKDPGSSLTEDVLVKSQDKPIVELAKLRDPKDSSDRDDATDTEVGMTALTESGQPKEADGQALESGCGQTDQPESTEVSNVCKLNSENKHTQGQEKEGLISIESVESEIGPEQGNKDQEDVAVSALLTDIAQSEASQEENKSDLQNIEGAEGKDSLNEENQSVPVLVPTETSQPKDCVGKVVAEADTSPQGGQPHHEKVDNKSAPNMDQVNTDSNKMDNSGSQPLGEAARPKKDAAQPAQQVNASKQGGNKHQKSSKKSVQPESKQKQSHKKKDNDTSKSVKSESKSTKSVGKAEKESMKTTKSDNPKSTKKDGTVKRRSSRDEKEYQEEKEYYRSEDSLDDLDSLSSDFSQSDLESLMTISELSSEDEDESEGEPLPLPGVLVRALNFPLEISEKQAFEFFKDYNPMVDSARMSWTSKGAVIVNIRMNTTEDAEAAIKNLNQTLYLERPITVFLAGGR